MFFDDPICLDRASFEELINDTLRHRMCWMYHDILSDSQVAWMFNHYAGTDSPCEEAWTTTAWVAAGRQEEGFYLLFKWHANFYGPPVRCDLYYIDRPEGLGEGVHIRYVDMEFQQTMNRRGQACFMNLWAKISENATSFFGENEFDSDVMPRLLNRLERSPGRELETFESAYCLRSDGERFLQCGTAAAYFQGLQAIREIIMSIVVCDGGKKDAGRMHIGDFLDTLSRLSVSVDFKRLEEYINLFRALGAIFCRPALKIAPLGRGAARTFFQLTAQGELRWLGIRGRAGQRFLRELYLATDLHRVWEVFHRWQGEVLFTVVRSPHAPDLYRGVYLLTRFEDHTGLDVTSLFWLENVTGGQIHLCQGEHFDELLDFVLTRRVREATVPGRWSFQEENAAARGCEMLTQAFEKYSRTPSSRKG